jgi:hypothetical protein
MDIDKIPNASSEKLTERIAFAAYPSQKRKLEYLRDTLGKDVPEFLRMLLDEGLKDIPSAEAS